MDIDALIAMLHPFERKVLLFVSQNTPLEEVMQKAELSFIEAMRGVQWLENKQLIEKSEEAVTSFVLGKNGKKYATAKLPEIRLLQALTGPLSVDKAAEAAKLERQEVNLLIGMLRKEGLVSVEKKESLTLVPQKDHTDFLAHAQKLQDALEAIGQEKVVDESLTKELLSRKDLIEPKERKIIHLSLTADGQKLLKKGIPTEETVNRVTSNMLRDGSWQGKNFRAYDIQINVPKRSLGRIHMVTQAVDYIKRIWLDMGFEEMTGDFVHTAFWDLDALFVPQDHPAREMQDTFYIKSPQKGKLPACVDKIKAVHLTGGDTGSKGWGGDYSDEVAKENLLRTHTTVLSAQTLHKLSKEDLPAKFFAVGKVFRNEALDWKHLFEFFQVEGIVVDPDANLAHLKGYLTQFYKKMGYEKVRMRPGYFPYVSPGLEVDVFHPVKKQWVELGGAGIFRPEVTRPLLGFDCPVLAWGQGMGRIISEYWKITDIRDLYKNDLKQLRDLKVFIK